MKIRLIAPAIALALLAAGCSGGDNAAAEPSAAPTTAAASAPSASPSASASSSREPSGQQADDSTFLLVFTATFGETDEFSGEELVTMAKDACTKFSAGKSHMEQVADIALADMTKAQQEVAVNAMSAGVANYCPELTEDFFGEG